MADPDSKLPRPPAGECTVLLERMGYGAKAIGYDQGKVILVAGGVPGDRAVVRLEKVKKRFAEGQLIGLVEASSLRQVAPCPWAEPCGGCQWQGIDYAQQLAWKKEFVESALRRIAKLDLVPDFTIEPSADIYHYRNRVQLKGLYRKSGQVDLGYFKVGSHSHVRIEGCKVAEEPISAFIKWLSAERVTAIRHETRFNCSLQVVQLEGKAGLLVDLRSEDKGADAVLSRLAEHVKAWPYTVAVSSPKAKSDQVYKYDQQDGISYFTAMSQFQQVNLKGNHKLRQHISDIIARYKARRVLDLFCGSGNLSLGLLKAGDCKVLGIEVDERAIASAKLNLKENGLSAGDYRQAKSESLEKWLGAFSDYDLVLLDPPRGGLGKTVDAIPKTKAPTIVYVSCDPNTLARDLHILCQSGYKLVGLKCFDFFPHSYHVETVAVLERA